MRFFKSNNFVLKLGFLRPSTLYPIFFQRPVFFICDFNFFHRSPSSIFTKNETFCDSKGLVKVFGTMRLQKNVGDLQKNFSKTFWKNFGKLLKKIQKKYPSIFCLFLGFSVEEDGFFVVFSWGKMVFETYAHPFGYFLAL